MKNASIEEKSGNETKLSQEEIRKITDFENRVGIIDNHSRAVRLNVNETAIEELLELYLQDPGDESFSRFKEALIGLENLRRIPKIQFAPELALARVVDQEIKPFLSPIVDRFHMQAKDILASVTESERAAHLELTGIPDQNFTTKKMESARQRVHEIEEVSRATSSADPGAIRKALASLKNFSLAEE